MVKSFFFNSNNRLKSLIFLKELVEKGEFKPVIDRQYNLDQIIEAYKYVETGVKTGNVVIKIVE